MTPEEACILIQDGARDENLPPALAGLMRPGDGEIRGTISVPGSTLVSGRVYSFQTGSEVDLRPGLLAAAIDHRGLLATANDLVDVANAAVAVVGGAGFADLNRFTASAQRIMAQAAANRSETSN